MLAELHEGDIELPQVNDEILLRLSDGHDVPAEKTIELAFRSIERVPGEMETLVAQLRAAGKIR